mgnify:CR=1 FL=1|tara:strand:- start:2867 stop:3193 length:327 start_codon:yes stop_codon:yes gene_type:complete
MINILNDPRHLTTYKTQSEIDRDLINKANITNNYEYRMFLVKNASNIINVNNMNICNNTSNCSTNVSNDKSPYIFKKLDNNIIPNTSNFSDLKTQYLSRDKLNSRLEN